MSTGRLSPPTIASDARSAARFPFGLAPRGFFLLTAGLLWLVPAWMDRRAITALVVWNVVVLALALFDIRRMPLPSQLTLTRAWSDALTLGSPAAVTLDLHNRGTVPIDAWVTDYSSHLLSPQPIGLHMRLAPGGVANGPYNIEPRERGDVRVGPAVLHWRSRWGIAERWATVPLEQIVRVYPNLQEGRRESLYLIRSRQIAIEKRRTRHRGTGREFESLRDYRTGDERRDICWTAAARRGRLVTKVYQPERSQAVWILVDAGRLLRARAGQHSMLDHSVTGALTLAQVAMASGDRIGLLAYGRAVQRRLAPSRGATHLRAIVEALALVRAEAVEADHAGAAAEVLRVQKRRALIAWLTDIAETAGVPDVFDQTANMTSRHVVLFAVMRHPAIPALAAAAPRSAAEMYRVMSVLEVVERREALLHGLRQRGALVIEGSPAELGSGLVRQYLEIKDRGLL